MDDIDPTISEQVSKEIIDITTDQLSSTASKRHHSRSPSPSNSPRKRIRTAPSTKLPINVAPDPINLPPTQADEDDLPIPSHPPTPSPLEEPMTLREISLLRRLKAKEIQVNSLLETLTALSQNPASRPPPPPLPGSSANSIPIHDIPPLLDSSSDSPVAIPKALLPVLAQLRARTQQLVEENTLLKSLLEEEEEIVTPAGSEGKGEGKEREVAAGIAEAKPTKRKGGRIDLKKVVERTKLLTKENEELGAALEEFEGWASVRGERTRYEESIRESHEMIRILDADLDLSQSQMALVLDRLEQYQQTFGPLPLPSSAPNPAIPPPSPSSKGEPDLTPSAVPAPVLEDEDVKMTPHPTSPSLPAFPAPSPAKKEPLPSPDVAALLAILSP